MAARFEENEYLPYWCQIWPASLLLAEAVAAWGPAGHHPPRVLEVGCGLGLVSLLLSHLGYRVVAADYDRDALAFVAENARRNSVALPRMCHLDWRTPCINRTFDRIVAADVLYEERNALPVAGLVRRRLKREGLALIADPNRSTADEFPAAGCRHGLAVAVTDAVVDDADSDAPIRGRIFHLRRQRQRPASPRVGS